MKTLIFHATNFVVGAVFSIIGIVAYNVWFTGSDIAAFNCGWAAACACGFFLEFRR